MPETTTTTKKRPASSLPFEIRESAIQGLGAFPLEVTRWPAQGAVRPVRGSSLSTVPEKVRT